MRMLVVLFVIVMGFLFAGDLDASAPVKVTITGCVTGGVLMSEKTDFGTHASEGKYRIRVLTPGGASLDLAAHEGKRISIVGHLLPGDRFYAEEPSIRVMGSCVTLPEPETCQQEDEASRQRTGAEEGR